MLLSRFPPEITAKIFKDAGLILTGMRISKRMAELIRAHVKSITFKPFVAFDGWDNLNQNDVLAGFRWFQPECSVYIKVQHPVWEAIWVDPASEKVAEYLARAGRHLCEMIPLLEQSLTLRIDCNNLIIKVMDEKLGGADDEFRAHVATQNRLIEEDCVKSIKDAHFKFAEGLGKFPPLPQWQLDLIRDGFYDSEDGSEA